VFLLHLVQPLGAIPAKADRATRQHERMAVARAVAADLRAAGHAGPVYVPTYQWTAILRWHGIDARQLAGVTRPSHFTERDARAVERDNLVLFTESPARPAEFPGFGAPRAAARYPVVVRGVPYEPCWLLDYTDGAALAARENAAAGRTRLDPTPHHPPR
jgi:hypothetical protein